MRRITIPTDTERLAFTNKIELLAKEKSCSLFEAMIHYGNETDMEESVMASLIHYSFKNKLEEELRGLNLIKGKKPSKLPF